MYFILLWFNKTIGLGSAIFTGRFSEGVFPGAHLIPFGARSLFTWGNTEFFNTTFKTRRETSGQLHKLRFNVC